MRALALVVALGACGSGGGGSGRCGPTEGVVDRAIDGDTIELESGEKIRYLGVDTPETQGVSTPDCYGPEAKAFNDVLVTGKAVRLEYDVECQDRFQRTLAYVYLDDRMVNLILLERGYGKKLVIAPNDRYEAELTEAERLARVGRIGLWGACP